VGASYRGERHDAVTEPPPTRCTSRDLHLYTGQGMRSRGYTEKQFGIGVGTAFILTINVVLIRALHFGCPSFRHLIGGRKDCMSDCGSDRGVGAGKARDLSATPATCSSPG